jgi:Zn-dependent protease
MTKFVREGTVKKIIKKFKLSYSLIFLLLCVTALEPSHYMLVSLLAAAFHELGHIFCARALGVRIKEMRLDLLGALLDTDGAPISYGAEFMLCAAGPLASFLGFAVANGLCIRAGVGEILTYSRAGEDAWQYVRFFGASSLFLGVLNLLPVSSFDGGRMLSATLSYFFGDTLSSRICDAVSFLSVFTLWSASVYVMLKVGAFLSLFVFSASVFSRIFIKNREAVFS